MYLLPIYREYGRPGVIKLSFSLGFPTFSHPVIGINRTHLNTWARDILFGGAGQSLVIYDMISLQIAIKISIAHPWGVVRLLINFQEWDTVCARNDRMLFTFPSSNSLKTKGPFRKLGFRIPVWEVHFHMSWVLEIWQNSSPTSLLTFKGKRRNYLHSDSLAIWQKFYINGEHLLKF